MFSGQNVVPEVPHRYMGFDNIIALNNNVKEKYEIEHR